MGVQRLHIGGPGGPAGGRAWGQEIPGLPLETPACPLLTGSPRPCRGTGLVSAVKRGGLEAWKHGLGGPPEDLLQLLAPNLGWNATWADQVIHNLPLALVSAPQEGDPWEVLPGVLPPSCCSISVSLLFWSEWREPAAAPCFVGLVGTGSVQDASLPCRGSPGGQRWGCSVYPGLLEVLPAAQEAQGLCLPLHGNPLIATVSLSLRSWRRLAHPGPLRPTVRGGGRGGERSRGRISAPTRPLSQGASSRPGHTGHQYVSVWSILSKSVTEKIIYEGLLKGFFYLSLGFPKPFYSEYGPQTHSIPIIWEHVRSAKLSPTQTYRVGTCILKCATHCPKAYPWNKSDHQLSLCLAAPHTAST